MTAFEIDEKEFFQIVMRKAKDSIISETKMSLEEIELRVFSGIHKERD
jgi:hypothetical protein